MKRVFKFFIVLLFLVNSNASKSQVTKYTSSSGELIFSFANYVSKGNTISTPVRFTCFFHASTNRHIDFGKYIGAFTGLGIRNVGFTSSNGDTFIKRRNYYVGVPLAIKLGKLADDTYFYAGVEGELGLNYKEKIWINEKKVDKFNIWFSDRTPLFMPSAFIGFNMKGGLNLKFKYYLSDFLVNGYDYTLPGSSTKVFQSTKSQIFYFSLSYNKRHDKKVKKAFNKET